MNAVNEFKRILNYPTMQKALKTFDSGLITHYEFLQIVSNNLQQIELTRGYLNTRRWILKSLDDLTIDEMFDKKEFELGKEVVKSPVTGKEYEIVVELNVCTLQMTVYANNNSIRITDYHSFKDVNKMIAGLPEVGNNHIVELTAEEWKEISDREINAEAMKALDEHEAEYGADERRFQLSQGLFVM